MGTFETHAAGIIIPAKKLKAPGLRAILPAALAGDLGSHPSIFSKELPPYFFPPPVTTTNNNINESSSNNINNKWNSSSKIAAHSSPSFFSTLNQPVRIDKQNTLKLLGANVRSLFSPENFYFLHKLLEEREPDVLFLVET